MYTEAAVSAIGDKFATLAGIPPSDVTVSVTSASVRIMVTLYVPEEGAESVRAELASTLATTSAATTFLAGVGGLNPTVLSIEVPPTLSMGANSAAQEAGAQGGMGAGAMVVVILAAIVLACGAVAGVWCFLKKRKGPIVTLSATPSTTQLSVLRRTTGPDTGIPNVPQVAMRGGDIVMSPLASVSATPYMGPDVLPSVPVVSGVLPSVPVYPEITGEEKI